MILKKLLFVISSVILFSYSGYGKDINRSEDIRQVISEIKAIKEGTSSKLQTGRELTHLLLEAYQKYDQLSSEDQALLQSFKVDDKEFNDIYNTPDGNFKIYFRSDGPDALPWVDKDNNGYNDLVENYGRWFMDALNKYQEFGLKKAYSQGSQLYKVYISDKADDISSGVLGYTRPESYTTGPTGSIIVVRSNYKMYGYGKPKGYADSVAAQITITHEFMHAVQMAYTGRNFNMFVMEGCAVWSEQFVYPGELDPVDYVQNFLNKSNIGINYNPREEYKPDNDAQGSYNLFPYGSWIFFKYLTDRFGNEIIKDLYEAGIANNEIKALNVVIEKRNLKLNQIVQDFWTMCMMFSENPDKKPYYFSMGKYFNYPAAKSPRFRAFISKTLYTNDEITVNNNADILNENDKVLNRLGAHYIRFNDKIAGKYSLTPMNNRDSLVLIVCQFQYKLKQDEIPDFKIYQANAFAGATAEVEVPFDPNFKGTAILVFNHNQRYMSSSTSWGETYNSAYYNLKFSAQKNSVEDDMRSLANGFMIEKLYPMPASDKLTLLLNTLNPEELNINIYDNLGRTVASQQFLSSVGANNIPLSINGLAAGNYIVEVANGKLSQKMNFIKK